MSDEYSVRRALSFESYNSQAQQLEANKYIVPHYLNSGFVPTAINEINVKVDSFEQRNRQNCAPYIHLFNYIHPQDKDVLEVGCGFGRGCNFIKNVYSPKTITGCDINDNLLNVARRCFPDITFTNADAVNLTVLNQLFDIVVTVETLLYWDCHKDSFKSIASVVREGGSFVMASDMRRSDTTLDTNFSNVGLKLVDEKDITANVLLSLCIPTNNIMARQGDEKKIKMFTTKYKCVSKHYIKQ